MNRLIERWLISEHVLMRRIAVHVAGKRPGTTGSDHIRFVLDHDLARATGLAQEVLHLLGAAAPQANPELIDRLVDAWTPPADADDRDWYEAFAGLEWLERNDVDNAHLTETLAAVRSRLPEGLQGSPYPGMSSWVEVGSRGGVQPLTVEAFGQKVREAPDKAVQFVLGFEENHFPRPGETTREDAAQMMRDAVLERADAGLELWPHLEDHPELRELIIGAWGQAKESDDLHAIMNALLQEDLQLVMHGIGQFLIRARRSDGAPWETLQETERFMNLVWAACATEEPYEPDADTNKHWINKTFNEPVTLLMGFWFEMLHRRWTAAGDDWREISAPDKRFLEQALNEQTTRGALAQTQIAGQLHILDAADSAWCRSQVLPRRDWTDQLKARPFWWGVLSSARWNDGLVADGLLDGLIATAEHLDAFDEDQVRRWSEFLATIAVRCQERPASSWVDEMTAKAQPEQRTQWIETLGTELESIEPAGRTAVWNSWLADYWDRRTRSDPVGLSPTEANALAALALRLPTDQFMEAVPLVEATSAGLDSHGGVSDYVSKDLIDACSTHVSRFLIHLMKHTSTPFWGTHVLKPKLEQLVAKAGDWEALREASLRLGIDLA